MSVDGKTQYYKDVSPLLKFIYLMKWKPWKSPKFSNKTPQIFLMKLFQILQKIMGVGEKQEEREEGRIALPDSKILRSYCH